MPSRASREALLPAMRDTLDIPQQEGEVTRLSALFNTSTEWPTSLTSPMLQAWTQSLGTLLDRDPPRRFALNSVQEQAWHAFVRIAHAKSLSLMSPWFLQDCEPATSEDREVWRKSARFDSAYSDPHAYPGLLTRLVAWHSTYALKEALSLHGALTEEDAHVLWRTWLAAGSESQLAVLLPALCQACPPQKLRSTLMRIFTISTLNNVCGVQGWRTIFAALDVSTASLTTTLNNYCTIHSDRRSTFMSAHLGTFLRAALHHVPTLLEGWRARPVYRHTPLTPQQERERLCVVYALSFWARKPLWVPFLPQEQNARATLLRQAWTESGWCPTLGMKRSLSPFLKNKNYPRRFHLFATHLVSTHDVEPAFLAKTLYHVVAHWKQNSKNECHTYLASMVPAPAWWRQHPELLGGDSLLQDNPLSLVTTEPALTFLQDCGVTWSGTPRAFARWCDTMVLKMRSLLMLYGKKTPAYLETLGLFKKGLKEQWGPLDTASYAYGLTPRQHASLLNCETLLTKPAGKQIPFVPTLTDWARGHHWEKVIAAPLEAWGVPDASGMTACDIVCQRMASVLHRHALPLFDRLPLLQEGIPLDPKISPITRQTRLRTQLLHAAQKTPLPILHAETRRLCLQMLHALPVNFLDVVQNPPKEARRQEEGSATNCAWNVLLSLGPNRWGPDADTVWDAVQRSAPSHHLTDLARFLVQRHASLTGEAALTPEAFSGPPGTLRTALLDLNAPPVEQRPFPASWINTPARAWAFLCRLVSIDPYETQQKLETHPCATSFIWEVCHALHAIVETPLFEGARTPDVLIGLARAAEQAHLEDTSSKKSAQEERRTWCSHDRRLVSFSEAFVLKETLCLAVDRPFPKARSRL